MKNLFYLVLILLVGSLAAQPSITSYSPSDGATVTSGNLVYTIEFDEAVNYVGADGSIYLRQIGASTLYQVTAADVTVDGSTVTVVIDRAVPDGSISLSYELYITDTAFENLSNQAYAGNLVDRPSITVSYTNPTIASLSPADEDIEVSLLGNLTITFNENIRAGQYAGEALYDIRVRSSIDSDQQLFHLDDPEVTVGTNSITINPGSNFRPEDELFVNINYGVIELDDVTDGLYLNPITSSNTWNFTTEVSPDNVNPTIQGRYPSPGGTCIGSSSFNVVFNEQIQFGTGQLSLYKSDGTLVSTIDMETDTDKLTIDLSDQRLRFDFGYALEYGQDYYIQICNTCVEDLYENPFDGIVDQTWDFTSSTKASLTSTSPADGAENVDVASDLVLNFSEFVQYNNGTKMILVKKVSNDDIVASVNAENFDFDMTNPIVNITLPTLPENTELYVELEAEALSNNCGVGVDAITGNSAWTFTTSAPDTEVPTVISTVPADDATNIAVDFGTFVMNTSEPVQISADPGVAGTDYYLEIRFSTTVVKQFDVTDPDDVEISGNQILLKNIPSLDYNKNYTVRYYNYIGQPFEDLAGNKLGNYNNSTAFVFQTEPVPDVSAPYIVDVVPEDGQSNIGVDIATYIINMNENVKVGDAPGTAGSDYNLELRKGNVSTSTLVKSFDVTTGDVEIVNNVVTLKNLPALEYSTDYFVTYLASSADAITDLAGNALTDYVAGDVKTFSTMPEPDITAPVATSTSPSDEGTYAPLNASGGIVFNEDVQQATGTIELYLADGTLVESIPTGEGDSRLGQPAGFRITWDFDTDLIPSTGYYILVSEGAYEDAAGNPFAGIGIGELDFTANARPLIESLSPADGATDVALNASITLDLDVDVYVTDPASTLYIKEYATDNIHESFNLSTLDVGDGAGSFPNGTITISPTIEFQESTEYYMVIEPAEVIISSLNIERFQGLDDKNDWTFTTDDFTAPTTISFSPTDGSSDVPFDADLVVTFNEPIQAGTAYVRLRRSSDSYPFFGGRPAINTNLFTINDDQLTIHLAEANLLYPPYNGEEFYIEIENDAIEDLAGNAYSGFTDNETWNFTSGPATGTTAPEIVSLDPADDAVDVDKDGVLTITFDKPVFRNDQTNGYIYVRRLSDDQPVLGGRPAFETEVFSINGNQLTIDLSQYTNNPANYGTEYYVEVRDRIVIDADGNHFLGAFGGDDPTTWSFTTAKGTQIIEIAPIEDKDVSDAPFDVEATVNTNLALTYEVTGPATISGNTITLTGEAGIVEVTVSQAGNEQYIAASETISFEVVDSSLEDQTITFNALSAKTFGDDSFELTATSSSSLDVSYSSSNLSVATISGSTVTIVGAGTTVITASQAGNDMFNPALPVEQTLTVNKADQSISITPISDKVTTDAAFDVIASTTSELELSYEVTGPASISGTTITLTGATGTVDVVVSQVGNENYNSAISSVSFVVTDVAKTDQSITFNALSVKTYGDDQFELTASASSNLDVLYSSSDLSVATISGSTVTIVGAGSTIITASQAGNDEFNPATPVQQTLTVNKADQTISISPISDKLTTDAAFDVIASTSSELALSYEVTGPASISGTTITLAGTTGMVEVTVSQSGNENYNSAVSTTTFEVLDEAKTDQTITFEMIEDRVFGDDPFELTATASSGLTVSYSISDPSVATVTGTTVTILGAGTAVITANQEGDDTFNPATPIEQMLTVNKADQTITINPISDKLVTDESFDVIASTSSELELNYEITGPASITGITITLTGAEGTVEVIVSQAGNENFNSASAIISFDVTQAPLSVVDEISMKFYPNPVHDYLMIESKESVQIRVFDMNGRVVLKANQTGKIDFSNIDNGTYIIEINSQLWSVREKIVKAN